MNEAVYFAADRLVESSEIIIDRPKGTTHPIDLNKKDAEVKLLIACKVAEAEQILAFHNRGSQTATLILR